MIKTWHELFFFLLLVTRWMKVVHYFVSNLHFYHVFFCLGVIYVMHFSQIRRIYVWIQFLQRLRCCIPHWSRPLQSDSSGNKATMEVRPFEDLFSTFELWKANGKKSRCPGSSPPSKSDISSVDKSTSFFWVVSAFRRLLLFSRLWERVKY